MQSIPTIQSIDQIDPLVKRAKAKTILPWSDTTFWRNEKRGILVPVLINGQCYYRLNDLKRVAEG
ncbi:MAG: hypothetical protein V7708_00805 [Oceanicoccus sp.]